MAGAGSKTEVIAFERETRTRQRGGDHTSSWAILGEMWAAAEYAGGSEGQARGAVRPVQRYRFTVWTEGLAELGVTQADRIVWNGTVYNLREAPRRLIASPETVLIAESGVTQ